MSPLDQQLFDGGQDSQHHSSFLHLQPRIELREEVGPLDVLVENEVLVLELVFDEVAGKIDQNHLPRFR